MEAIKPDTFFTGIPSIKEKQAEKAGATDEEKILHGGSNTAFWRTLKAYLEELSKDLDNINEGAIATGASLEEIGMNTVVVNLTSGIIGKVINKVEDAREACEKTE